MLSFQTKGWLIRPLPVSYCLYHIASISYCLYHIASISLPLSRCLYRVASISYSCSCSFSYSCLYSCSLFYSCSFSYSCSLSLSYSLSGSTMPHEQLLGIRRVSTPSTSIDPGSLKIGFLVLTKMHVLFEIMVQIKQKRGAGVKNASRPLRPSKKVLGRYM